VGITEETPRSPRRGLGSFTKWRNGLIADPKFQKWAAKFPLTKWIARKDGEKLFDLVSGFVYSQTLYACVDLNLFEKLMEEPKTAANLAFSSDIPPERMEILCNSASSLGLLHRRKDDRFELARLGAALLGVPGLQQMIRHHDIFYRDMSDPLSLLRGEKETELANFWPYVLGETEAGQNPETTEIYSDLMAKSQALVAEETLNTVGPNGKGLWMDVGGGTGSFLKALTAYTPAQEVLLFDLPDVVKDVTDLPKHGGSFLRPLPNADTISLVRVLYDHSTQTVETLLARVFEALPKNGRLVISEPMSGGTNPIKATDSYFAFYTMAMRTGQVRSQREISDLLERAGFVNIKAHRSNRAYITSVLTAEKLND